MYPLLMFLLACSEDFSGGLFWSNSRQNLQVTQPCSVLHSSFRSGVTIGRNCQNDSTWSSVDLTNCTMFAGSSPVVVVYFTVIFDGLVIVDENEIIKNVSILSYQKFIRISLTPCSAYGLLIVCKLLYFVL